MQAVRPTKRVRPDVDNERTRTLRSAQPSEEPSLQTGNGFTHVNSQQASQLASEEESDIDEQQSQPLGEHIACRKQHILCLSLRSLLHACHTISVVLHPLAKQSVANDLPGVCQLTGLLACVKCGSIYMCIDEYCIV